MKIQPDQNQLYWDKWFKTSKTHNKFSQSWGWGDILLNQGFQVERLQLIENEKIVGQTQVVYNNLPFGWKYIFCPKGPDAQFTSLKELIKYFKAHNNIFLRVEPNQEIDCKKCNIKKTIDINPRATVILDLKKTEEDLLKEMKSKTRYNIRLAERKEIKIVNKKDLKSFVELSKLTAKRDGFKLHDQKRYKAVLNSDITYQLSVIYKNQTIATAVFIFFGDTFTYLYGASDYKHRQLMAPYLLQWEAIKLAKEKGYKYYDLFGIAPAINKNNKHEYSKKHQYAGVTRFKLGFGGEIVENPGTFDVILNHKKYALYKILRKIRRLF